MNKIAKIILPVALDKEFDYSFSENQALEKGMRVLVDFRGSKAVGLVTAVTKHSKIKKLKNISGVLDSKPLLDEQQFSFAKELSRFYPYGLGEFLFMMLPMYFKGPHPSEPQDCRRQAEGGSLGPAKFIKSADISERYYRWRSIVSEKLKSGSVLVCLPQISYLSKIRNLIERDFPSQVKVLHSHQSDKEFFQNWRQSRQNCLIIGMRMALFYYPADLNLIVIEEENSPYYFQEEKPFYHLRQVASLLSKNKGVDLILAADTPSLVTYKLICDNKVELIEGVSETKKINLIDLGGSLRKKIIGPILIELLGKALKSGKTAVILWNKKGFSQAVACSACGHIYKCEHCSGFLQLSLSERVGTCPYCHRRVGLPELCSHCRKGYLKSLGFGIEGVASLLKSVFPQVRIDRWQKRSSGSRIIISTVEILNSLYDREIFDAGFLLDTDAMLGRPDYQATFNTYLYIKKLGVFFREPLYVFTANPQYYLFDYLNQDWRQYYAKELSLRKKMGLPPYKLLVKISLRSKKEKPLLKYTQDLYNNLKADFREIYGPSPDYPFKLRDKFRYLITIRTEHSPQENQKFAKKIARVRRHNLKLAIQLH